MVVLRVAVRQALCATQESQMEILHWDPGMGTANKSPSLLFQGRVNVLLQSAFLFPWRRPASHLKGKCFVSEMCSSVTLMYLLLSLVWWFKVRCQVLRTLLWKKRLSEGACRNTRVDRSGL